MRTNRARVVRYASGASGRKPGHEIIKVIAGRPNCEAQGPKGRSIPPRRDQGAALGQHVARARRSPEGATHGGIPRAALVTRRLARPFRACGMI